MPQGDGQTAIILGGGGARAAYQVGALRAIAHILARRGPVPFPVLCGTSAGAINAVALAVNADDFRRLPPWRGAAAALVASRIGGADLSRGSRP